MKKYLVSLPITGSACIEVEAEDEDSAIEKALASDVTYDDITEWECHRCVVRGNVFYGNQCEAEAQEA